MNFPETITTSFLVFLFLVSPALSHSASDDTFYTRGTELARSGKFGEALKELEKAAELAPNNPKVHNMLGIVLTQLGRLKEANEAYSRALALDPDFLPARKNRAVNSFTRGDFKFAAGEFEAIAQREPGDFVPRLFLGLLAIEARDLQTANKQLIEARQLSPGNARVLLALTRVRFALGERQLALESAGEMAAKRTLLDAEKFELGVVLAQFDANAEAIEAFQTLWQKKPGSYDVGFNLALLLYRSGQLASALRTAEELGSYIKPSGELLNLRGWIYNKMRRLDKARESLEMAIAAEPDNVDHYLDLSSVLNNERDIDEAVRVVFEGLQRNVEKDRLQVQMGLLYQKKGDFRKAEEWYKKALQGNSGNRSAYLALASLMLANEHKNEALDLLPKAIEALPADFLLRYVYGAELLASEENPGPEQLEKVASILKKALELNPYYANTHYVLGKLYLRKGDEGLAQLHFEKACAYKPDHASAYYQLSLIARRQGKAGKASELGRIVQKLNEEADKNFQESFMGVVQESLRSTPGGTLVHQPKN